MNSPGTMLRLESRDEAETLAIGRVIGGLLRAGDVVAIDGPLGAGKTRLVRGIALGLGIDGAVVSSPTFVVVNEYEIPRPDDAPARGGRAAPRRLYHVDAYRLTSVEDLDTLGWDRVTSADTDGAVAVEWAERIAGFESGLGPSRPVCRVRMEPVEPETPGGPANDALARRRRVTIEPPPDWRTRGAGVAAADLELLAGILPERREASGILPGRAALPRGWGRCPSTGRPVPPDSPTFPFVDARARLADLGRWMSESYTISRDIRPEDD